MTVTLSAAQTTPIITDADTGIREFLASSAFGDNQVVIGGTTGPSSSDGRNRGLFHFNLSGIPTGATITDVQLTLNVVRVPPVQVDALFGLRPILQSWSETTATWNNPGAGWHGAGGVAGLDFASSSSATLSIDPTLGSYTFASTGALEADVQAWLNNPSSNFGWMLLPEDEGTDFTARQFASREGGSPATLLVSFVVPEPNTCAILLAGMAMFHLMGLRSKASRR